MDKEFAHLLATMNTKVVCPTVSLGMGTEFAVGMGAHVVLVGRRVGVFRAHVELECLALEESLATDLTGVRHLLFMTFHVVVHGVLLLLNDAAGGADEVTGFIANVFTHGDRGRLGRRAGSGFNFLLGRI